MTINCASKFVNTDFHFSHDKYQGEETFGGPRRHAGSLRDRSVVLIKVVLRNKEEVNEHDHRGRIFVWKLLKSFKSKIKSFFKSQSQGADCKKENGWIWKTEKKFDIHIENLNDLKKENYRKMRGLMEF